MKRLMVISLFFSIGLNAHANWITLDKPGATRTEAYDIDGSNIVGTYQDGSGRHGFLYDGSTWTTLDTPGASRTEATGIDGTNIVGWYRDGSGVEHGFLYDGSTWTTLDTPGAQLTNACGIEGDNIIGFYRDGPGVEHGFIYDHSSSTWDTLDKPGVNVTRLYGIEGDNKVGLWEDGSGVEHGFLYDGSTWTTLDKPGAIGTTARDIEGNSIVGWYEDATGQHGFIYDRVALTWTPLDAPGASLTTAHSIDGGNIVGLYDEHGFLYIPEPPIEAAIDIDPDTLDLSSRGKWVTCYIELPEGFDVIDIDGETVMLYDIPAHIGEEGWARAGANSSNILDHDGDGIQERMVKFDRSEVQAYLTALGQLGYVELMVSGGLIDGPWFEGIDVIRVVDEGPKE